MRSLGKTIPLGQSCPATVSLHDADNQIPGRRN
jgi:hypothetical protein